ncbi:MAG: septum site-determining protein MinC [Clostridiales bacterium]|jgi:septum site-determining protein MinC|nr:septum site-determining protein MinC [Clostridiales bacterium]
MSDGSVVFKGTVNGLTIIMKEEEAFETILADIESRVSTAGKFFKGAILDVKYRGKKLSKEEEQQIFKLLDGKSGATIKSLKEEKEDIAIPKSNSPKVNSGYKLKMRSYFFKGLDQGPTKFYRGTVRSGQLVSYDGNLVVIGDVNPGGEVVAAGNVIVMGSLRGIVHAGVDGNKEAIVAALSLQPTQLRIADVITRPPDEKESKSQFIPELAMIKDDVVYIERYLPQR